MILLYKATKVNKILTKPCNANRQISWIQLTMKMSSSIASKRVANVEVARINTTPRLIMKTTLMLLVKLNLQ